MKPRDLILGEEQLRVIQGVEQDLRRRRRAGLWGLVVAFGGGILNVLLAIFGEGDAAARYGEAFDRLLTALLSGDGAAVVQALAAPEVVAVLLVALALGVFLILRTTRFFLGESKEPFRYTFWIDAFSGEDGTDAAAPAGGLGRIERLLHHDLRERVTKRIPRFSLLDPDATGALPPEALSSHIQVTGSFLVREVQGGHPEIQVMSRIRIGGPGTPETLARPLRLPLEPLEEEGGAGEDGAGPPPRPGGGGDGDAGPPAPEADPAADGDAPDAVGGSGVGLSLEQYDQLVERVYSQVATEIYRRLEADLEGKIELFPTNYLRAVALYNEAEDLARSNTVDAYDRAVGLYREARRRLGITLIGPLTQALLRIPLLWRREVRYEHAWARIQIGYAKCLVYRRLISALAGQRQKPLFEVPRELDEVLRRLGHLHERFHRASWTLDVGGRERWRLERKHVQKPVGLVRLVAGGEDDALTDPVTARVRAALAEIRAERGGAAGAESGGGAAGALTLELLLEAMNRVVCGEECLYDLPAVHESVSSPELRPALFFWSAAERARMNRLILEEVYAEFLEQRTRYRLGSVISFLTFPRDSWGRRLLLRPPFELFREQTRMLFEAHVVTALAHHYLGAVRSAREHLRSAAAVAPLLVETSSLYKLAAAEVEADLDKEVTLFRQALALDREFEIAQYRLAQKLELRFRREGILDRKRARPVLEEYRKVLNINPGNIAALAALGYLHWLVAAEGDDGKLDRAEARRWFEEILEFREIARHESEGEALYGLARLLAEEEELERSNDRFAQALDADPLIGAPERQLAFAASRSALETMGYYDQMGDAVVERYRRVERRVRAAAGSSSVGARILGFVLNDLGNALYKRFKRSGIEALLDEATACYEKASGLLPDQWIVYFNLYLALGDRYKMTQEPDDLERAKDPLAEVQRRVADWSSELLDLVHGRLDAAAEQWESAARDAGRGAAGPDGPRAATARAGGSLSVGSDPAAAGAEREPGGGTGVSEELMRAQSELDDAREMAERIVAKTKMRPVLQGLKLEAGAGIDALLDAGIEAGRLDEGDLAALFLWAELRRTAVEDEEGRSRNLWTALRVLRYIDRDFYFDSFKIAEALNKVIGSYRSALAGRPEAWDLDAERRSVLGLTEVKAGRIVRDKLRAVILADPEDWAALTWVDRFPYAERVRYLEEALALAPPGGKAPFLNLLGNLYHERQEYDEAIARYQAALQEDEHTLYLGNLANSHHLAGHHREAERAYERAIALSKDPARRSSYENLLGNVHHSAGEYDAAMERYKKALRVRPTNAIYWSNLANSARQGGHRRWAERAYRRAIRHAKAEVMKATYHNGLGNLYHDQERYAEAVEEYREAIRLNPDEPIFRENMGNSALRIGDHAAAREAYMGAIRTATTPRKEATNWNLLGNVYHEEEAYLQAVACYEKALELVPDEPVYWGNLAGSRAAEGRVAEARPAFDRAIELATDPGMEAHYANLKGLVDFRAGAFRDAAASFARATEREGTNPTYWGNLATAATHLAGHEEVVKRAAEKVLELSEDEAQRATYRQILEGLTAAEEG